MSYWNNRRICSANGGLPPALKCRQYYSSLKIAAWLLFSFSFQKIFKIVSSIIDKINRRNFLNVKMSENSTAVQVFMHRKWFAATVAVISVQRSGIPTRNTAVWFISATVNSRANISVQHRICINLKFSRNFWTLFPDISNIEMWLSEIVSLFWISWKCRMNIMLNCRQSSRKSTKN